MQTKEDKSRNKLRVAKLTDKREYTIYRESVPEHLRVVGRDYYFKIVKDYYETISEMATEYDGGVCINKVFYLFYYRIPKKMGYKLFSGKHYNLHTDNHVYAITMMFPTKYSYWNLRKGSFNKTLRKKLSSLLRAGEKFKAHFYSLKLTKKI